MYRPKKRGFFAEVRLARHLSQSDLLPADRANMCISGRGQAVDENGTPRIAQRALEIFAVAKITARVLQKQVINAFEKVPVSVNAGFIV